MIHINKLRQTIREFREMPRVGIDLMRSAAADNDPFFVTLVNRHFASALRRHPRYLVIPQMVYGVALQELPESFDQYYMAIEASARRNHKKAVREGCGFQRIDFNDHLAAIAEIRQSTDKRQGRLMPDSYRRGIVNKCTDPPSRNPIHDYPFFGVFHQGKLVGYASCLIAGQLCNIEHILGHSSYLTLGAVPQLIIGIAEYLFEHHTQVRFYSYGTYFGAEAGMQRFKRKFGFVPHRVDWRLDGRAVMSSTQGRSDRPGKSLAS